jgi:hypothetical protein
MQPLVLQLQADCLDSTVSILEVLRKALVVARKLSLADAVTWIEMELKGFTKRMDAPPPHRMLTGQISARNPYHGWQSIMFDDTAEAEHYSKCFVGQPVGELEDLLSGGSGTLVMPFDPAVEQELLACLNLPLQPIRQISRASIKGILDAVRHMVLEWCLKLEEDGIVGEGMTFNAKEKEAASHVGNIINFNAPVGHSQVQQGTDRSTQSMSVSGVDGKAISEFIGLVTAQLEELKLASGDRAQLQAEVQTLQSQLSAPRPNDSIMRACVQFATFWKGA